MPLVEKKEKMESLYFVHTCFIMAKYMSFSRIPRQEEVTFYEHHCLFTKVFRTLLKLRALQVVNSDVKLDVTIPYNFHKVLKNSVESDF